MKHLRILALLLVSICAQVSAQWIQLPGKGTHSSLSIYAYDNTIVVATQDSNILRSTDQGVTWEHSSQGIEDSIHTYTLYGDGATIYLGSNRGGYISRSGGVVWQKIDAGPSAPMNVLTFHRYGMYLFMGGDSGMFRSSDNGQSWQIMSNGLPSPIVRSFASNDKYLYAGTTLNAVYRSTDNGEHWELSGTGMNKRSTISSIWTEGADVIGFFEGGGAWYRSTDYGDTWKFHPEAFNSSASTEYCVVQIGTTLLIGTENGVQRSLDKGASWKNVSEGMNALSVVQSISIDGDYIYAGSTNHWIWRRPLSEILPPAGVGEPVAPYALRLNQSAPNPTAFATEISYSLPNYTPVSLKLYNAMMQEVSTLVDEPQEGGEHHASLDVSGLPSGVYYYRLSTGISSLTRRMVVVK